MNDNDLQYIEEIGKELDDPARYLIAMLLHEVRVLQKQKLWIKKQLLKAIKEDKLFDTQIK